MENKKYTGKGLLFFFFKKIFPTYTFEMLATALFLEGGGVVKCNFNIAPRVLGWRVFRFIKIPTFTVRNRLNGFVIVIDEFRHSS